MHVYCFNLNSKNIVLYFRGNLPKELHSKLKGDLITGILQKQSHILEWRHQFSTYCKDSKVLSGSIEKDFDYLEEIGVLQIGRYDVLKNIFSLFDVTAVEVIDNASKEIEKALYDNNQSKTIKHSYF